MKIKVFGDSPLDIDSKFSVAPVSYNSALVAVYCTSKITYTNHMTPDEAERMAIHLLKSARVARKRMKKEAS